MAASSQVSQNKRGRDEYGNGESALPDAKRSTSVTLMQDSNIMALFEMIDNMEVINTNPEEIHTMIQLEDERLNGLIKSMEDEVGLKGQADDVDAKGSVMKQLTDWNPQATAASDTGDVHSEGNLTYYDDVRAQLSFFVDHNAVELGIIMNLLDGDLIANMYSDAGYGYPETPAVFYESLWEDEIWELNEHHVIQNDFELQHPEEFEISGTEFHG